MSTPRVYGMSSSGNCYKVRLLLEQREPIYRELAHIELDVNSLPTDILTEKLVTQLRVALSKP